MYLLILLNSIVLQLSLSNVNKYIKENYYFSTEKY